MCDDFHEKTKTIPGGEASHAYASTALVNPGTIMRNIFLANYSCLMSCSRGARGGDDQGVLSKSVPPIAVTGRTCARPK